MKVKYGILVFTLIMIFGELNAQLISSDGKIMGQDFKELTYEQAVKMISKYSYKKSIEHTKYIKWDDREAVMIKSNAYDIRYEGKKYHIEIRGRSEQFLFEMSTNRSNKLDVYQEVVLGHSKMESLPFDYQEDNVLEMVDSKGKHLILLPYQDIYVGIAGTWLELNYDLLDKKRVSKLVWRK